MFRVLGIYDFANRRQIETSFPNGINDIILCTRGIKNKDSNCYSVSTYHTEIGQDLLKKIRSRILPGIFETAFFYRT